MNYSYSLKQLGLFSFIIALLSIASCKKPTDGVGEDLVSGDLLGAMQTDSTRLSARTIKGDTINTSSTVYGNVMIGNYQDLQFGTVSTASYMQFDLSTVNPRFPENMVVDSVVLALAYFGRSYGKNEVLYYQVQQLSENIDSSRTYYSNDVLSVNSSNQIKPGFEWVDPKPELITGSTISSNVPTLRIRLKEEIGTTLLNLDTAVLDKFNHFKEYFKGLRISSSTLDGQVVNYDISNSATKLIIYYRDLDQAEPITQDYNFIFTSRCKAFTGIQQQYNGTPLTSIYDESGISGNSLCYAQSGGGTFVAVNISEVTWLNDYPNITVNRAELIVPYESDEKFAPINLLLARYKKADGKFSLLRDDEMTLLVGGGVRIGAGLYSLNITGHVQSYLRGEIESDDIYLIPNAGILTTTRSILRGPEYNTEVKSENMRLAITYSFRD